MEKRCNFTLALKEKSHKKALKHRNIAVGTEIVIIFAAQNKKESRIMATAIKAIPTLYGDAARRFRDLADEAEMRYERSEKKDRDKDPFVIAMREMLKRSGLE